jgi:flagellar biosynthesis protein FlhG
MNGPVDQADGLRRLLTAGRPRMVAVVGMSRAVGATTAAANLSVELARRGKAVLLLDEHPRDPRSARGLWSVAPQGDLAAVACGRIDLLAASALVAPGVRVLPAIPDGSDGSFNPRALCPNGVIVVDVAGSGNRRLSQLARMADDLIVVMQPCAASITATYAGLKDLQYTHALQTFQFLVNDAATERQAQLVIANVVATSSRYLAVSLRSVGWVPSDMLVPQAACLRQTVCEAFPGSSAATAFRGVAAGLSQAPVAWGATGVPGGAGVSTRHLNQPPALAPA